MFGRRVHPRKNTPSTMGVHQLGCLTLASYQIQKIIDIFFLGVVVKSGEGEGVNIRRRAYSVFRGVSYKTVRTTKDWFVILKK